MSVKLWYVYLLRCADDSLYCGVTTALSRRIDEHNGSNLRGAKYTRTRRPVSLAFAQSMPNRSLACKREYEIKQLSKRDKEQLCRNFLADPCY